MSNYDLLKQKIQDKIPKLLEMSKGQLFTIKNMPFYYEFLHFIYNDDEEIVEVATLYNGEIDVFDYEYFTNQQITIYGKDPMLNDVLNFIELTNSDKDIFIDSLGQFFNYSQMSKSFGQWDLSSQFLKDQKKELIDWLVGLN